MFDVQGARAAGYSEAEIASFLGQQAGFDTDGAMKSGHKPADIIPFLSDRLSAPQQDLSDGPQPLGDASGAGDFAATMQGAQTTPPEVGGGRGFVNPPPASQPQPKPVVDRTHHVQTEIPVPDAAGNPTGQTQSIDTLYDPDEVTAPEALARGWGEAGAKSAKYLGAAASAIPVIAESLINVAKQPFGGKPDYSWQDASFRQLVGPAQNAIDYYALKPEEKLSLTAKIAHGVGGLLQDLPAIVASGGLGELPVSVAKNPGVMEFVSEALSHGFDAMRPAILKAAGEKADQVLQAGGSPAQAAISATAAGMWTGVIGAVPLSMQGNRVVRAVTGFPTGVALGEGGRVIQNAVDPASLQQPFDAGNAIVAGAQGSILAAGMPGHVEPARPERPDLGYSDLVPDTQAVPQAERAPTGIDSVLQARSVDEAIAAATRAASPDAEGSIRAQMLAIRPLEDAPNVSAETAIPARPAGADRSGSADAARSVASGDRSADVPVERLADEPAPDRGPADALPRAGSADAVAPVESRAADQVERQAAEITARRNDTGTLTVQGDPASVAALLRAYEIPFVPSLDGALVGKSRADEAERTVQDFRPQTTAPEAATAADSVPPPAARLEPPVSAQPGVEAQRPVAPETTAPKVEPLPDLTPKERRAIEGNPFRTFLMRQGVALRLAQEFAPGTKERLAMGRTFRKDGLDLDALADRAAEQGFIKDGSDVNELYGMIVRAVSGERIAPMYGHDAVLELRARVERQRLLDESQARDDLEKLPDEALDDDVPWENVASNASEADAMRALGFTEKEIADATAERPESTASRSEGRGEPDEAVAREEVRDDRRGEVQARGEEEGHGLASPTVDDVIEQQRRREVGEREIAQRRADEEAKAKADAQLPDFGLTGSDRPADANPDQDPLFRRGSFGERGITREQLRGEIAKAFGKDIADRLMANRVVVPIADQSKLPEHVVPFVRDGDIVYGFYDPKTDRTYAVLGNLKTPMVKGLVIHEVGVHYGFENMLGRQKYAQVMERIAIMGKAGNREVIEARDQARANSAHKKQIPEETLAYLVQAHPELGIVRDVIARLKAFMFEKFGIGGKYLSVDDLTALAKAAVLHSARAEPGSRAPDFARDSSFARATDDQRDIRFARAAESEADLPEEVRAPYSGPGARMVQSASDFYTTLRNDLMKHVAPMSATDNKQAQAMAQQYANQTRWAQVQWGRLQRMLEKSFTPAERERMWNAADAENVARTRERDDEGYQRPEGAGLDALSPKEREAVQTLHDYGQQLWNAAKSAEMVEGDGLPFWTPRMLVTIGEDGDIGKLRSLSGGAKMASDGTGRNITTTASSLKQRKYLTAEETEAAGSKLAQEQGAQGAKVVRDIMTMPLTMYRLERAIAGRQLVNQLKAIGQATGEDLVRDGHADGFITIPHPAFTTYHPRFEKNEEGKTVPVTDAGGNVVLDRVPLYIRADFEGPLRAVMSTKDSSLYTGYMLIKSKAMSAIMVSPLIHNMVIWGKALPASPLKVGTLYLYAKGHQLLKDNALVKDAVLNGMVPIGENHSQAIDVTDIAQNFKPLGDRWGDPNESWITLGVEKLGNLLHEGAGTTAKEKMDAAGEFLHHTLLWKQVGALQMGIYADAKERYIAKGFSEEAAGIQAAHLANRYGGVVAKENQSELARKAANVLLFSRSFNFTNLGTIKDAFAGMPAGLKALLSERAPADSNRAEWVQRRKAWSVVALDVGFAIVGLSLMQDFVDAIKKDKSADDIVKGYANRLGAAWENIKANPLKPSSYSPYRLSSTWANEPGKKDRIDMGTAVGEQHEYMRLPVGKVAEDLVGWVTDTFGTFEKKAAPIPKALAESAIGKTTIGMPVEDPNGSIIKRIGEGAAHVLKAQMPWDDMTRVYDWMNGHATDLDKKKVAGTVTGFTFSQGHPAGPEGAVNQQTTDRFEASKRYTMAQVKEDLKRGNEDAARDKMEAIGMTPREITHAINQATEPRSGLSKQARQKFERRASDEERQEMDQQRR